MSIRALLQNTKLSQKVADFVKATTRGEAYNTSNLSCLIQVTSTNPCEISDMHHFLRVNNSEVILKKLQESNDSLTLQGSNGSYFDLRKWNFIAYLKPDSNELHFEIEITDLEYLGGIGTLEQSENPTNLLDCQQVKEQLARLKKYLIAKRFNNDHPYDPSSIDEARFQQSERIRKNAHPPRHFETQSMLQDPFLVYAPHGHEHDLSQSNISEFEELPINTQTEKKVGDHFKVNAATKKPYNTLPNPDPFALNLEALPTLEKEGEAGNTNIKPTESNDSLPTFGGGEKPNVVSEQQPTTEANPLKRNFDKYDEEQKGAEPAAAHESKKTKAGWGINYQGNQNTFMQFRQGTKTIENKKSDPLELLNMEPHENQQKAPAIVEEPHKAGPPETKLSRPLVQEEIESEEEKPVKPIDKKPFSNAPKSFYKDSSPDKTGAGLLQKMLNKKPEPEPYFGETGKEVSFGKKIEKNMKQSSIDQFADKKKVQKSIPASVAQPKATLLQVPQQTYQQPKPQSVGKGQIIQTTTYQQPQKSPRRELEPEDIAYLNSFAPVDKISPQKGGKFSSKKASPSGFIDLTNEHESHYLKSFADLSSRKSSPSIKSTNSYIQNPFKPGSQIDLTEFKIAKPRLNLRPAVLSSSTLHPTYTPQQQYIPQKPTPPAINSSLHFSVQDFQRVKMLFEQS